MRAVWNASPANDGAEGGLIPDRLVTEIARLEERQREHWARELGLDPARVDFCALPPVPVEDTEGVKELLARATA